MASTQPSTMTRMTGCPVAHMKNSLTAGPTGPVMMQDAVLLEKCMQFSREKIPARNVHALGCGAYGTFVVTNATEAAKYTRAALFQQDGKKTSVFVRFSGVFTEQGEADLVRDLRGFAAKFYTEEGNWDLLCVNTPCFNCRDMKVGPDVIHSFKRDPRTGNWNPTQTWDFVANHPESLHQTLMLFTDCIGTPMSFRTMHAYGIHTFAFINAKGERFWVKFHILAEKGEKGFDQVTAKTLCGEDPNFLQRDLREAIAVGNFPRWKFCVQVMREEEGYRLPYAFDPTKVWKHADYPLIELGYIVLDKLPVDFHSEVEQVAFSPATVPPGIGFSPDKLLQGRLLIYDDTQYHRLGDNFKMIPVNRPLGVRQVACPWSLGGQHNADIKNAWPHFHPSTYGGPQPNESYREPPLRTDGPVDYYDFPNEGSDEDWYAQPRDFWQRVLRAGDKEHLVDNMSSSLARCDDPVVHKILRHLRKISEDLGAAVESHWRAKKSAPTTPGERVWLKANRDLNPSLFKTDAMHPALEAMPSVSSASSALASVM